MEPSREVWQDTYYLKVIGYDEITMLKKMYSSFFFRIMLFERKKIIYKIRKQ